MYFSGWGKANVGNFRGFEILYSDVKSSTGNDRETSVTKTRYENFESS